MDIKELAENVNDYKPKSTWQKGVKAYALELTEHLEEAIIGKYFDEEDITNRKLLEKALLNGAENWSEYSWGGCAFIYDQDIAERLCTPSELKKTDRGRLRPNRNEEWLDCQARALSQAANLIVNCSKKLKF